MERDGEIIRIQAALIVIDNSFVEVVETTITNVHKDENIDKIEMESNKSTMVNNIHVEVIEEEISATVYIILMIIVGAFTVLILAGAAIIFTKIKYMPL